MILCDRPKSQLSSFEFGQSCFHDFSLEVVPTQLATRLGKIIRLTNRIVFPYGVIRV
jgi:hypothetical protein